MWLFILFRFIVLKSKLSSFLRFEDMFRDRLICLYDSKNRQESTNQN